jgi:GT2 family glycosyltransferase
LKSELKRVLPWGLDTNLLDKFVGEMFPKNYLIDTPEVHGFCLIARSSAFNEIGYFNDEAFPFGNGEETDWCLRAREFGYKLAVLPSLFVFHHGSGSFDSSRKEQLVSLGLATLNKMYGEQVVSGLLHQHQNNLELIAAKNLIKLRLFMELPPL